MLYALLASTLLSASAASPTQVVKEGNAEVQRQLSGKTSDPERLAKAAEKFVDFAELAKRALGKEWEKLTKVQRAEFSETMKGLLRASYAQKAAGQADAKIRYGAEKVTKDEAEVATTLTFQSEELPVVYKLYQAKGKGWRIFDVETDGVSLLKTYSDQFRKLIAEKGFDGLLATLKAKRAQLEKPKPSAGEG